MSSFARRAFLCTASAACVFSLFSLGAMVSACDLAFDLGITAKVDAGPSVDGPGDQDAGDEAPGYADGGHAGAVADAGTDAQGLSSLVGACSTSGGGVQAGSPWPMEGRCPTRQSSTSQIATRSTAVRWTFNASSFGDLYGGPSIAADGTVYVVAKEQLLAVRPDGTLAWSSALGGTRKAYGVPTLAADGTIYVAGSGTPSGALVAFTPLGKQKWVYDGPKFSRAPSVAADGTLYVPGKDGRVYAIRPDGSLAWTFTTGTGGAVWSSPTIRPDGVLYFGSADGTVYALRPDGSALWSYASGAPIRRPVVLGADGAVYALNSKVVALDSSGKVLWKFTPPPTTLPALAVAPDGTLRLLADTALFALTREGHELWGFVHNTIPSSTVAIDGSGTALFVIGDDYSIGRVYAVDASGKKAWDLALPKGGFDPAIGADGTVYFTDGSKLYAIGQ